MHRHHPSDPFMTLCRNYSCSPTQGKATSKRRYGLWANFWRVKYSPSHRFSLGLPVSLYCTGMMLLKIRNRHYFSFFALAGKAIDGQKSDIKRINIKLFPSSKRVT
ncbi:hypothetical protein LENED_012153 [Lentinula edodes]|uniref:Uncharacterized protein n=1 Tax=Lentinula edodes TaxID=5353 RepID=A0A1Q3ERW4_LENED|nr:hypothetical protein LENED_012153 [Lentinula edodes]